jgi:hypothetical protein
MSAARQDERGMAALFVIGMSVMLLVCAGLVVDGGLAINARMRTADDAEQAARVGADSVDLDVLRSTGAISIDVGLARQRAAGYLATRGYGVGQYAVDVQPDGSVEVEVEDTTSTLLLGIVGIGTFTVGAGATATPQTGVDQNAVGAP